MYENWKFVKLNEKKDGATDWPNKDVEAQSDSNRALCDTQTSSWQEIIYLPQNRESECLGHCVVTKTDLGHYVLKNIWTLFLEPFPAFDPENKACLMLRIEIREGAIRKYKRLQ